MKTPIQKVLSEVNESIEYNSNVHALNVLERIKTLCESLIPEERKVIESAFANGYLKTQSATSYFDDNFDPKQLELFE